MCETLHNRYNLEQRGLQMNLHWEASYEIVLALIEHYPDAQIETLGLQQLKHMVLSLPDFEDDPTLADDATLQAILREWYEEVSA